MEILNKPMYGGDGSVWFEAVVGDREYDEILDFTANRKDYVKVDHTLLVNGVWVNGEKYISQFEFNRLQYDLEEYQEVNGILNSEVEGLKKEIESLKKYNTQYAKRNYELKQSLVAAEEENQKLIDKNWELENALMGERGYYLDPLNEVWIRDIKLNEKWLYKREVVPIGKVI